jgi:plastocyanin
MKKLTMLVLVLAAIGLVACGGGDSDSTTTAATEASTTASAENEAEGEAGSKPANNDDQPLVDDIIFDSRVRYAASNERKYAYYITEASASPGKIKFQFGNTQTTPHNVALEAPNGETIGETETISDGVTTAHFVVKPGVYTLYCSVPGHRKKGMLGHLTVK